MVQHKKINQCDTVNRIKDKNHMTISDDGEKAFDKIKHPFMIKILSKLIIEENCYNTIKSIYKKHTANMVLSGEKLEFSKIRNKRRMPTLTTSMQHHMGKPSQRNQTRKIKASTFFKKN